MTALPILISVLCILAIAYRYYSAFLAAKVCVLNDSRVTPAFQHNDGHNYHPTNKWVLFGHHFAAISGAGPLIGPVLALQFGYLPGLLWLVVGVVLAGAVQDFVVLVASVRHDGKSLAEIVKRDISPTAGFAAGIAILFVLSRHFHTLDEKIHVPLFYYAGWAGVDLFFVLSGFLISTLIYKEYDNDIFNILCSF